MASLSLLAMSLSRHSVSDYIEGIWEAVPAILDVEEDQETVAQVKSALKTLAEELLFDLPDFLMEDEEDENEAFDGHGNLISPEELELRINEGGDDVIH